MRIHQDTVRRQGGVVTRATLLQWGNTVSDLHAALARGDLTLVRRGWYSLPGADPQVVRAVRSGGSLGCVSALRRRGVWSSDDRLHIHVPRGGRHRLPSGACACGLPKDRRSPKWAVDPVPLALATAARCCDPEAFLVLLDSVVNLHLLEADEIERLFAHETCRIRAVVARMDRAESGTETMVRDRLRRAGLPVRTQVEIAGVGRVDLLVGERLVVEVDSIAHHTSRDAYARDRRRDRQLRALGYEVVRLTYAQVHHEWEEAQADIVMIHRRLRRRGPLPRPQADPLRGAA